MSNARLILNAILIAVASAAITAAANAQSPPIPPALIPASANSLGADRQPAGPDTTAHQPPAPGPISSRRHPHRAEHQRPKSETKAAPRAQPRIIRPANLPVKHQVKPAEASPWARSHPPLCGCAPRTRRARPRAPMAPISAAIYLTAFGTATKRVEKLGDIKAMTLFGELYANGYGVMQDDNKAAEWYRLAAERGDREAMFALAMFRMGGRGGAGQSRRGGEAVRSRGQARSCRGRLRSWAALSRRPDVSAGFHTRRRAVPDGRAGGQSGSAIRARHALQGRPRRAQECDEATRWLGRRRRRRLHRRAGRICDRAVQRHRRRQERGGGRGAARRAARKGSPIAQNRLAHISRPDAACAADPVEAIKWHLVSKAARRQATCASTNS